MARTVDLGEYTCECGQVVRVKRTTATGKQAGQTVSLRMHDFYVGSVRRSICECQRRLAFERLEKVGEAA